MKTYATRVILSLSFVLSLALVQEPAAAGDAEALNAAYAQYKSLRDAGRYAEAAPFAREALQIGEELYEEDQRQLAHLLGNLAELEDRLGNADEAETLYRRTLAHLERQAEQEPRLLATTLSNLAELERARGRPAAAEPLSGRALGFWRETVGPGDQRLATALANHGAILLDLDRPKEALPLLRQALAIRETALGSGDPGTQELRKGVAVLSGAPGASSKARLARQQQRAGRHPEAERLYREAVEEQGDDGPNLSPILRDLAKLLMARGAYGEAEELLKRALAIHAESPEMRPLAQAAVRRTYAVLLRRTGRPLEAERLEAP